VFAVIAAFSLLHFSFSSVWTFSEQFLQSSSGLLQVGVGCPNRRHFLHLNGSGMYARTRIFSYQMFRESGRVRVWNVIIVKPVSVKDGSCFFLGFFALQ